MEAPRVDLCMFPKTAGPLAWLCGGVFGIRCPFHRSGMTGTRHQAVLTYEAAYCRLGWAVQYHPVKILQSASSRKCNAFPAFLVSPPESVCVMTIYGSNLTPPKVCSTVVRSSMTLGFPTFNASSTWPSFLQRLPALTDIDTGLKTRTRS